MPRVLDPVPCRWSVYWSSRITAFLSTIPPPQPINVAKSLLSKTPHSRESIRVQQHRIQTTMTLSLNVTEPGAPVARCLPRPGLLPTCPWQQKEGKLYHIPVVRFFFCLWKEELCPVVVFFCFSLLKVSKSLSYFKAASNQPKGGTVCAVKSHRPSAN